MPTAPPSDDSQTPFAKALAVIPARFASTRFPGKPLADATGRPLIQHVVEQVRLAQRIGRIIVATDDQRIADAVVAFGGEAMMTGEHPNGTSRIAEVVRGLACETPSPLRQRVGERVIGPATTTVGRGGEDPNTPIHPPLAPPSREGERNDASATEDPIIINIQGDEPQIEPHVIDELIAAMHATDAPMATLASTFADDEDPADPNIVKVVIDQRRPVPHALYFSRSLIPFDRDGRSLREAGPFKHPGLYAYRRAFLLKYVELEPTPLEQVEQLEQLRALEHGYSIAIVRADVRHHGIDTPAQYDAFVRWWQARSPAAIP